MDPTDATAPAQQQADANALVAPATVKIKFLTQTRPDDYDADYFRRLRALYEGGKKLLGDHALLAEILPKHRSEHAQVYRERQRRAFYVGYAAEIIDHIVAALMAEPVRPCLDDGKTDDETPLPPFYAELTEDVSPAGGEKRTLHEFIRDRVLEALITRRAWALVDLPDTQSEQFVDRGEQEHAGALDAYFVPLPTESVVDWEQDEDGELSMAVIYTCEAKRTGIDSGRAATRHRWRIYTRENWALYEFVETNENKLEPEKSAELVGGVGTHSFGRVPVVQMVLPPGLWAMNKLEGPAREHFNKRNQLAWGETQSLLPELYEFLAPEGPSGGVIPGENQQDPGRATSQPRGQGYVQQRGAEDKAAFVGPDADPFKEARASCSELRDEMHRVMHQMALSADNSGAALKRSAESKQQDAAATGVVLGALGQLARKFVCALYEMASLGRKDTAQQGKWHCEGLDRFDAIAPDAIIDRMVNDSTIGKDIPSATFQKLATMQRVEALLESITPDQREQIEKELEENITPESVAPIDPLDMAAAMGGDPMADDVGGAPPMKPGLPKPPQAAPKKPPRPAPKK